MTATQDLLGALLAAGGREDPYPLYRALHERGPVLDAGGGYTVAIGHAAVDRVLRDPSFRVEDAARHDALWPDWRSHPSIAAFVNSMLMANSPRHERMRSLVSRAFTARRVAGMRPAVERLAGELCDRMADEAGDGGTVDVMERFAFLLPVTVIGELLGVPEDERAWLRPVVDAFAAVLEMTIETPDLQAADAAARRLEGFFAGLVEERRRHPGDDLVSDLLRQRDDTAGEPLPPHELLGNLALLLAAGFETTTNLLGNGVAVLLADPALADALRADPALVAGFVEEVLRWDSPVQLTHRIASRPGDVGGLAVAPGAPVLLLVGGANRDPRRFADPDRFDPRRPDNAPLSFGAGAHHCLGAALARLEGQVAFTLLTGRFPRLAAGGPARRRDRLTLRGYAAMPITLA